MYVCVPSVGLQFDKIVHLFSAKAVCAIAYRFIQKSHKSRNLATLLADGVLGLAIVGGAVAVAAVGTMLVTRLLKR